MDVLPYTCLSQEKKTGRQSMHPLQMAYVSEDLKCWGAWDSTSRHRTQGHHTIDRLEERQAQKEEALDDLPWKDVQERAIVNPMNTGTFSQTRWGNLWEMGWSVYIFFLPLADRHHLELNWTELNSTETRTQTVGPATNLAALLDVGEHDDLCDAFLPDHPPEVADAVGTRT